MLVELGLVEQRYKAVLEVLDDGASVTDVARRYGVGRQTVHTLAAPLRDRGAGGTGRPQLSARRLPAPDGAGRSRRKVVEMRRLHPAWGPRTIANRLAREGVDPLPVSLLDLSRPRAPPAHRPPARGERKRQ